ncbi:TonB-dependent receptor [Amphiplicatus metriothermophilus]|uniref:TonB-dependent receptor n=1 Tax=Amphiplicatus metriothermophilus TaxID=1519374 RepID=A0A239PW27_9PROT|nr:TonB-dependent receptor [Amphiplicatus metriothermophilus]MBB5518939.1 TonB-dependent receptor [Amphiplicatus metriothermophilus]SNT74509.1 TonB-dependent receptor [Amphiplicatus metriothermophilus]
MKERSHNTDHSKKAAGLKRAALLGGASTLVMLSLAPAALAQDAEETASDEIIVTGVRASLGRAADIKRNSHGVVDAISAEDIGKFPDTNLAESLQRITGVSIDRVNGEGSLVTARGFGPQFNLVTLNGRHMPAANVGTIGGGDGADFDGGAGRSFDFQNLASEGVRRLEVYKTGRADIPTGGIGASVNVVTARPLDNPGAHLTVGAKALHDTSVVFGSDVTPEITGLASWTDESEKFGVSIFGAWQKRDSASAGATSNAWNVTTISDFLSNTNLVRPTSIVNNAPSDPDTLVTFPNDSRYAFAETDRERLNGYATVQFAPTETLTFTADAFYAQNKQQEMRSEQTNWFNRPFDEITFSDDLVPTTEFLFEDIGGIGSPNVKDQGHEQQFRSSKETLSSFGLNAAWNNGDGWHAEIDAHTSRAWSGPNSRNDTTSTLVSIALPTTDAHSLDLTGDLPVQNVVFNDCTRQGATPDGFPGTNCNGQIDIADLGSQVARANITRVSNQINEVQFSLGREFADGARLDFGGEWQDSEYRRLQAGVTQTLGDWGVSNPGDVDALAPGVVELFCLACQFNDFTTGGAAQVVPRGNALDLYDALAPFYRDLGNAPTTNNTFDAVDERILAIWSQLSWQGEFADRPAELVFGMRYEDTNVEASTTQLIPVAIRWEADNDIRTINSAEQGVVTGKGGYNDLLPSVDFKIEALPDVIARASYSETIARPNFDNLSPGATPDARPLDRPSVLGGRATGTANNTGLLPLRSKNFDVSLEWYFAEDSYVSIGFFDKRVRNFIGTGVSERTLFDLRDPTSGQPGTRSGDALDLISELGLVQNDVSLFTATALIDQFGVDTARTMLAANQTGTDLDQAFVDQVLADFDVLGNADDPVATFEVTGPINNREGKIRGLEFAFQHFFGEHIGVPGLGLQANYTFVDGDVEVDVTRVPDDDEFALVGLSNTANATLIYENYGVSARLAFNWRGEFVADLNQDGGNRNPLITEAYKQLDASVAYDVTDNLQLTFEGINLLGEDIRQHARSETAFVFVQELSPRFLFGARYRF